MALTILCVCSTTGVTKVIVNASVVYAARWVCGQRRGSCQGHSSVFVQPGHIQPVVHNLQLKVFDLLTAALLHFIATPFHDFTTHCSTHIGHGCLPWIHSHRVATQKAATPYYGSIPQGHHIEAQTPLQRLHTMVAYPRVTTLKHRHHCLYSCV